MSQARSVLAYIHQVLTHMYRRGDLFRYVAEADICEGSFSIGEHFFNGTRKLTKETPCFPLPSKLFRRGFCCRYWSAVGDRYSEGDRLLVIRPSNHRRADSMQTFFLTPIAPVILGASLLPGPTSSIRIIFIVEQLIVDLQVKDSISA